MPAEFRKGRRGDQATRLPPSAIAALERIRQSERELIFPWERAYTLIYFDYTKLVKAAGPATDSKSKFHRIRKSGASFFKAAGGDPTSLLGHCDPKTTAKYLDLAIVGTLDAADLLFTPGTAGPTRRKFTLSATVTWQPTWREKDWIIPQTASPCPVRGARRPGKGGFMQHGYAIRTRKKRGPLRTECWKRRGRRNRPKPKPNCRSNWPRW